MTRIVFGCRLLLVFVLSAAALSVSRPAARSTLNLPGTPYRYANVAPPAYFAPPGRNYDNTPPDNPLSDDGATLGRVLFYDTRLSANNTTSCASCHVQAHAFADPNRFSTGFHGAVTDRRAMPLVNVRYYERGRFFWDERAGNLEQMVLLPIQSRIEMGQDLKRLVGTLARDAAYPTLFARAFGDRQITERRIGKALAQFVRSIVSFRSRYDEGRAGARSAQDDFDNLTRQENRGKALFMRNCSTCHMKDGNEHFFVSIPANTGLRANDPIADGGTGDVTLQIADLGSFKSPSLRNVEVTSPYSHDGRFATLEAVINHYSNNAIIDPAFGYLLPVGPLKFTASEKAALIAFLKTLTDPTLLADPRFSNPFVDRVKREDRLEGVKAAVRTAGVGLMGIGGAAAQAPALIRSAMVGPELPALPLVPPPKSSHPVIERLESFDADSDQRLSPSELPERMQGLVARGDANADGALDSDEMRDLVNAKSSERTSASVRPKPSEGLPGVIKDLRLTPAKHKDALAIVSAQKVTRMVNDPTASPLYAEMRAVLDDEEYGNFVAAAARLSRRLPVIVK